MTDADRIYGAALVLDDKGRVVKDRFGVVEELQSQIDKQRKEIERLALLVHESVELETFWKRCAEQALRLWENSQDMRDELCKIIGLCATIDQVHEVLHDEWTA